MGRVDNRMARICEAKRRGSMTRGNGNVEQARLGMRVAKSSLPSALARHACRAADALKLLNREYRQPRRNDGGIAVKRVFHRQCEGKTAPAICLI